MHRSGSADGKALLAGNASGRALVLAEPLSFWGGVDATTGAIVDTHHAQCGESLRGVVLVMPSGRGSSSSSSVIAESIRAGTGPLAFVLRDADPIIALGCLIAEELYALRVPVLVLGERGYEACAAASESGMAMVVEATEGVGMVSWS